LRGSTVDVDDAAGRIVEAVDEFEQGRLAAAGGADQHNELARLDRQRDVGDSGAGLIRCVKLLGDVFEADLGRGVWPDRELLLLIPDGAPAFRVGKSEVGKSGVRRLHGG
jgi:hypothetical protein